MTASFIHLTLVVATGCGQGSPSEPRGGPQGRLDPTARGGAIGTPGRGAWPGVSRRTAAGARPGRGQEETPGAWIVLRLPLAQDVRRRRGSRLRRNLGAPRRPVNADDPHPVDEAVENVRITGAPAVDNGVEGCGNVPTPGPAARLLTSTDVCPRGVEEK
jgi:hypothetical protein